MSTVIAYPEGNLLPSSLVLPTGLGPGDGTGPLGFWSLSKVMYPAAPSAWHTTLPALDPGHGTRMHVRHGLNYIWQIVLCYRSVFGCMITIGAHQIL